MKKQRSLTEGPITSTLLWFTIPFLLSNLLQTLYGTVDTLTVGNFGSTAGVSAVSIGAQILSLTTFLAIGLSSGGTVLVGQSIGAKDEEKSKKVVGNMIIDFAVISVLLVVIMLFVYPVILNLLNTPAEAMSQASQYMRICTFGIPLIIGYNIVCALLRAMGDSNSPLLFVAVACVVNIIGDLLLTGYFHMGAAGVAIATVCAQGVSFIFSLVFIMKKGMSFPFSKKDIKFDGTITKRIFQIGVPMGIQSVLINLSFMFITSIINSMGLTASAAMGIGDKITGFAFMPQSAFSASLAVVVSQNVGANKPKRIIKSVKTGMVLCCSVEAVFLVFCQIWPNVLPGLFSHDEAVIEMAGLYMKAYSIDALLTSVTFCLSGLLNGSGKTTFNLAQNLIATFGGRIPATWLLSKLPNTNLFFIGLAAPASTIISVVLLGLYIIPGRWKRDLPLEYSNE